MTASDLKFQPCTKCGGVHSGFRNQRTVYWFADRVRVRCNHCNDILTYCKRCGQNITTEPCRCEGDNQ
jgi:hypothetical protein